MKTQTFIENNIGKKPSEEKWCSSVYQDTEGNFYSFGYHYPLLFKVKNHWFVNTTGYSNSTAKHINWAWASIGYHKAIGVNLITAHTDINSILKSLRVERHVKQSEIAKGREGSNIQQSRHEELIRINNKIESVKNIINGEAN